MLPLDPSSPSTSASTVLETLGEWSHNLDESVAGTLRFPTLASFIKAWLALASHQQTVGTADQLVFLMEAERLIDANRQVDLAWCRAHIHHKGSLLLAEGLLRDQRMRLSQGA